jgi:hypothetical protein
MPISKIEGSILGIEFLEIRVIYQRTETPIRPSHFPRNSRTWAATSALRSELVRILKEEAARSLREQAEHMF